MNGDANAWRIGRAVDKLISSQQHRDANYTTFEEYANARFSKYGYSTLRRYRRVAVTFPRATVRVHRVSKLELG
jgi:hypothetical protein